MDSVIDVAKHETFPRAIPDGCHAAVRAYLTEDGLLAPPGHPGKPDIFNVPCPKAATLSGEHRCRIWRFESRFECTCGANGDYWEYAALLHDIDAAAAYARLLKRMEIGNLSEIRNPYEGQRWYDKKAVRLNQLPDWVSMPPLATIERRYIPRWKHPASKGDFPPHIEAHRESNEQEQWENKLAFAWARKTLRGSVRECLSQIRRSERHTLLLYYRLGELLDRLKRLHQKIQAHTIPGPKWDRYYARLLNRSERYVRDAIRIFNSVEFIWQLEPYQDVKQFLDAISQARRPQTVIASYKDGSTRHTLTLQQKFDTNRPVSGSLLLELKNGQAASTMTGLDPTMPPSEYRAVAYAALPIIDKLIAFCVRNQESVDAIADLVDAIETTCRTRVDNIGDLLGRIADGLEQAAQSAELPEWIRLLPERRERDRKKRPNPPVETLPGSNYEADLREWIHDMAEAEDE